MEKIISEYEELLKVKEFHKEKKSIPLECTYQSILKTLQIDFDSNVKSKLDRWITISNARYFQYSSPVLNYFQAKMLYRDGYYEAAITFCRAICEMICYDYLTKISHPFGNYEDLEMENFRTLVKFLAIPKQIPKEIFEREIILKISLTDDRNLISSSYEIDANNANYNFKIANGKTAKSLNRFHAIFSGVNFTLRDNFPLDTYELINEVYNDGNTYVHARRSPKPSKEDAISCLNKIGKILAYLYLVDGTLEGKTIVSGYTEFPDICSGIHFSPDAYATPEDAMRGYYNIPSPKQYEKMFTLKGEWACLWKNKESRTQTATVIFTEDGEYLHAHFHSANFNSSDISIKLFGEYFHVICFENNELIGKRNLIMQFELEFLDDKTVVGCDLLTNQKVLLTRK